MKPMSIKDLNKILIDFGREEQKNHITMSILFITFLLIFVVLLIVFHNNYIIGIIENNIDVIENNLVYIILFACLFLYIYYYLSCGRNNGRSVFAFEHNCSSVEEINEKMNKVLKRCGYKTNIKKIKRRYKDEDIYTSSEFNKCIKYYIDGNKIIIQAWIIVLGRELPINTNAVGLNLKKSLLRSLLITHSYINGDYEVKRMVDRYE